MVEAHNRMKSRRQKVNQTAPTNLPSAARFPNVRPRLMNRASSSVLAFPFTARNATRQRTPAVAVFASRREPPRFLTVSVPLPFSRLTRFVPVAPRRHHATGGCHFTCQCSAALHTALAGVRHAPLPVRLFESLRKQNAPPRATTKNENYNEKTSP